MTDRNQERRLLVAAAEEAFLWEISWPVITKTRDATSVEPGLQQSDAVTALSDAVHKGFIELAEVGDENGYLSASEALKLSTDARYWNFANAPRKITLTLTETGRRRLAELTSAER